MKYSIVVGLEIECVNNIIRNESSYHRSSANWISNNWFIETDSSISHNNKNKDMPKWAEQFSGSRWRAEIISKPVNIIKMPTILKEFKSLFDKNGELDKNLWFNPSTGAHVHISVLNHDKGGSMIARARREDRPSRFKGEPINARIWYDMKFIRSFRQNLKRNMKSVFTNADNYKKWLRQYNRNYAKEFNSFQNEDRSQEFNFNHSGRIEFRSFNLCGVYTWKAFFKAYEVFAKTLRGELNKLFTNEDSGFEGNLIEIENIDIDIDKKVTVIDKEI